MMPIQPIPPRSGVKRPAPIAAPLPIKSERESKRIYVTENGNFVAYSERLNAMKICQDCAAKGIILSANYKDTKGQQKLCKKCASALGTHSKALGTWKPRSPCEKCATDNPEFPKEAAYMNAEGQKNKLCASCAAKEDCFEPQNLCEDCVCVHGKTSWPQNPNESCGYFLPRESVFGKVGHYRENATRVGTGVGTEKVLVGKNSPKRRFREAVYENLEGEPRKLCGPCAKKRGTWELLRPCEVCKKYASYKNSKGEWNKLCADCAHAQHTWEAQNRCTGCKTERGLYVDRALVEGVRCDLADVMGDGRGVPRNLSSGGIDKYSWMLRKHRDGAATLCFWCKRERAIGVSVSGWRDEYYWKRTDRPERIDKGVSTYTFLRPEFKEAEDKKWAENPTKAYNDALRDLRSRDKTLPHKCDGCDIHFKGQRGLKQHRLRLAFT